MGPKTIIKFMKGELQELLSDPYSHLILKENVKHKVALTPNCLNDPEAAIYAILNRDLMNYHPKHKGILLSYKNVRRLDHIGSIVGDNCHIFIDLVLDLYIFAPTVGCTLKGIVNKKSPDGVGCLVHKGFNVAIPRPWDGTNDHWPGNSVQIGQDVMLEVEILNFCERLPYIRGKLVVDDALSKKPHKIKKKSKDKLQATTSDTAEIRNDLAVSNSSLTSQKKRKKSMGEIEEDECLQPETSFDIADEISAMLKAQINKESNGELVLSEQSLLPQMYNDRPTLTDKISSKEKKKKSIDKEINNTEQSLVLETSNTLLTIPEEMASTQKKKKKKKSKDILEMEQVLLPVTSNFSNALDEIIPMQKNKKKKKSKDRLEVEQRVLPVTTVTDEISPFQNEKKKRKSKDKLETEQSLPPITSNFSTVMDEISPVQENKKKRKSREKLQIEQSKTSETSDCLRLRIQNKIKHSEAVQFGNSVSKALTDETSVCDQDHVGISSPYANREKDYESVRRHNIESRSDEDLVTVSSSTAIASNIKEKHKKRKISGCDETGLIMSDVSDVFSDECNNIQPSYVHNKMKATVDSAISTSLSGILPHAHKAKKAKKNKKNKKNVDSRDNIFENIDAKNVTSSSDQESKLKNAYNTLESSDAKKLMKKLLRAQKKHVVDNANTIEPNIEQYNSPKKSIRNNENLSESDNILFERSNSNKLLKKLKSTNEKTNVSLDTIDKSPLPYKYPQPSLAGKNKEVSNEVSSVPKKKKHKRDKDYEASPIGSSNSIASERVVDVPFIENQHKRRNSSSKVIPVSQASSHILPVLTSSANHSDSKRKHLKKGTHSSNDRNEEIRPVNATDVSVSKLSRSTSIGVKYDEIEQLKRTLLKEAISKTNINSSKVQPYESGKDLENMLQPAPIHTYPNDKKTAKRPTKTKRKRNSSSSTDDELSSVKNNSIHTQPNTRDSKSSLSESMNTEVENNSIEQLRATLLKKVVSQTNLDHHKKTPHKSKKNSENIRCQQGVKEVTHSDSSSLDKVTKSKNPSIKLYTKNSLHKTDMPSDSSSSVKIPHHLKTKPENIKSSQETDTCDSPSSSNDTASYSKKKQEKTNRPTSMKNKNKMSSDLATQLLDNFLSKLKSK